MEIPHIENKSENFFIKFVNLNTYFLFEIIYIFVCQEYFLQAKNQIIFLELA